MKKRKNFKFFRLLKLLGVKLFRSNDSAQKIALGFGLGVFLGIIPSTGPIAALVAASLFRLNRAAAFFGSLLTNTWINFVAFIIAIKIGSSLLGLSWENVYTDWTNLIKDFRWSALFNTAVLKIIFPVVLGYIIIAFCLGILAYLAIITVIFLIRLGKRHAHQQKTIDQP